MGSIYDIFLFIFGNDNELKNFIEKHQHKIKMLNIKIIYKDIPIKLNEIKSQSYQKLVKPFIWDFMKLLPWTMTEYSDVIFLDSDMIMLKNMDHIFELKQDFVYCDGTVSPFNSGFFKLKPNLNIYNELLNDVIESKFSSTSGWYNKGLKHKKHNAIQVIQGLLYYYFNFKYDNFNVLKMDRLLYNVNVPLFKHDGTQYIIHFTGSSKPNINHKIDINANDNTTKSYNAWKNIYNELFDN